MKRSALALLLLLLAAAPALAQGMPLSLAAYVVQLEETRAQLAGLAAMPDVLSLPGRAHLADLWEATTVVELDDGTLLPLDHSYLAALLRAPEPNYERIDAQIARLVEVQTAAHRAPPEGAREELLRILARPEFQQDPDVAGPTWWGRLQEELFELLDRLLGPSGTPAQCMGIATAAVLLLAFVAALAFVVRQMRTGWVEEQESQENGDPDALLTSADAAQRAEMLSTAGDYRTAVRYMYLAALLKLEEHGLLYYDRTLTNQEYARHLQHLPGVAAIFKSVVHVFDRVWYGNEAIDGGTYEAYAREIRNLERERTVAEAEKGPQEAKR